MLRSRLTRVKLPDCDSLDTKSPHGQSLSTTGSARLARSRQFSWFQHMIYQTAGILPGK
jgi:hypothetical protein